MSITILNPGTLTSVQDLGRIGYQQFGVSVSGVMDPRSASIANILVGNDEGEAVLECTMMGPHLRFDAPNIIAITGDMNDKLVDDYSVVTDLCTELVKIAPVYYVPGNHEWPKIVFHNSPIGTDLEAIGVHFLADETETLEVNGNTIAIGGVAEAPASYERYASAYFESFEQLDAFKLLLVHYPEYFLEDGFFSDVPVDLALCGHTHGGMIRIPGIGGLYTPDQGVLPTLTEGLHQIGDTSLIISRGLGDGKGTPVPRINNPPELGDPSKGEEP